MDSVSHITGNIQYLHTWRFRMPMLGPASDRCRIDETGKSYRWLLSRVPQPFISFFTPYIIFILENLETPNFLPSRNGVDG